MSIIDKLKGLELDEGTVVTLTYEEGVDVFVHNETEIDTALSETDVVSNFSELIATPGLKASTQYGGEVLESLREGGLLESYDRDGCFSDYLNETIVDNFYDVDFIEHSTEKYDHKRGFCTLTAKVQVGVENLISSSPFLSGWTASVKTDAGTLVME
jgi:hypothetical protein|tara:strand:+ start:556 stop:1026 length:471 start_codon:yes stop_codon:yes gene_type:complete